MNQLLIAAGEICEVLSENGWQFCIIGGLAVQRWGEPRTTLDVDITLLVEYGKEEAYIQPLLDRFRSRIPEAADFAIQHRVLLLLSSNGKDIDIALGSLPFEERMMQRAEVVEFAPGIRIPCCSAEDLFIMKIFAGRERDLADARSIVARSVALDTVHIRRELAELSTLTDAPDMLTIAENMLGDFS